MLQQKVISMEQYLKLQKAGKIKIVVQPNPTQPSHVQQPVVSNGGNFHSHPTPESSLKETTSLLGTTAAKAPAAPLPPVVENLCWSAQAAFQMLAVYESKKGSASFSKHDKKFWGEIADDLNGDIRKLFPRDIDWKQVKDKFHNLKGSMNGKRDWNRNSGNDPKKMTELEKRAEEIIHGKKDAGSEHPHEVNLQTFCLSGTSHTSSVPDPAENVAHPSSSTATLDSVNVTPRSSHQREITERYRFKPKKKHGTGSNVAKTKLQLEQQWLEYLKQSEERGKQRALMDNEKKKLKEELVRAKERKNDLVAKYLTQKEAHLRRKEERFRKKCEIDMENNRLLSMLVDNKTRDGF